MPIINWNANRGLRAKIALPVQKKKENALLFHHKQSVLDLIESVLYKSILHLISPNAIIK